MTKTIDNTVFELQGHSTARVNFRMGSLAALLVSLVMPNLASAAIMIDPGAFGDSFFDRTYNVTSQVRSAGVTNANGSVKVLDFIFSEFKALRVNGDGLNITAKLETRWVSNPSGIGGGFSLLFGEANSVNWTDDSATLFVDSAPVRFTTAPFTTPPNDFNITSSIPTHSFSSYLVDFNALSFNFRLPQSNNLGFNATVSEEQLVLNSAKLSFSSTGRPTGIPGLEVFSQYTVVSVPEPSTSMLTALALLSVGKIGRRRRVC